MDAIGFWPLLEKYDGRDFFHRTSDFEAHGIQHMNNAQKWKSSPGIFGSPSYYYLPNFSPPLVLKKSFSWMVALTQTDNADGPLFHYGSGDIPDSSPKNGPSIWIRNDKLEVRVSYPTCPDEVATLSITVKELTWNYLAVSFNYDEKIVSMWRNGVQERTSWRPCDEEIICSGTAVSIGKV